MACIEEIAYRLGFITREDLKGMARSLANTEYDKYQEEIADGYE